MLRAYLHNTTHIGMIARSREVFLSWSGSRFAVQTHAHANGRATLFHPSTPPKKDRSPGEPTPTGKEAGALRVGSTPIGGAEDSDLESQGLAERDHFAKDVAVGDGDVIA